MNLVNDLRIFSGKGLYTNRKIILTKEFIPDGLFSKDVSDLKVDSFAGIDNKCRKVFIKSSFSNIDRFNYSKKE